MRRYNHPAIPLLFICFVALCCSNPETPAKGTASPDTSGMAAIDTSAIIAKQDTSTGSEQFFAHRWLLVEVADQSVKQDTAKNEAHLLFYPGQISRVTGSTGCNRLTGTFELSEGGKIKFAPLATTRMMCLSGAETEQQFLKALENANRYYFTNNHLILLNGSAVVARLKATQVSD
jgi:heat shock protein HslJ